VFHLSEVLRGGGWQLPAYTLPADATDLAVARIVVREGFGLDLASSLIDAITAAVAHLTAHPPGNVAPAGFAHT